MANVHILFFSVLLLIFSVSQSVNSVKYEPTWNSLDSRPLPSWYDEAKLGIFIHWGVFSVPSFTSEWFWYYWKGPKPQKSAVDFMKNNFRPDFTYADFASQFTAEFYNPDEWADIFAASGAKYIVLTSKHHEGFTNWPSSYSFNWNSNASGPSRDLVGELANAIRSRTAIKFGLYHSLYEWFNPLYLQDKEANFTTQNFVKHKTIPELYEIINKYKPEVVWSDGDAGPDTYWTSKEFLTWLYNESPVKDSVVTNDRWGQGCACKHGGYYTCKDRYNPGTKQNHKWENCMTIDRQSWGYRRNTNLNQFLSVHEIISTLASTVSCGGNMLMNVGPTKEGKIIPLFEERLRDLGKWLKVNGEGIYSTVPWSHQNDTVAKNIWYTMKNSGNSKVVYAILLSYPEDTVLKLGAPIPSQTTEVTMLGFPNSFKWISGPGGQGLYITIPTISWNMLPCEWAWVLKITGLGN